jgi:hypothetical protein
MYVSVSVPKNCILFRYADGRMTCRTMAVVTHGIHWVVSDAYHTHQTCSYIRTGYLVPGKVQLRYPLVRGGMDGGAPFLLPGLKSSLTRWAFSIALVSTYSSLLLQTLSTYTVCTTSYGNLNLNLKITTVGETTFL